VNVGFLGSVRVDYQVFNYLYHTFKRTGHHVTQVLNINLLNDLDLLLVKDDCFTDTVDFGVFTRIISSAKKQGIPTAIILQDLEHVYYLRAAPYYETNKRLTQMVDYVFSANPNGTPIPREVNRDFTWLPNGYDPTVFYPTSTIKREHDVCFIGTNVPWIHKAVSPLNLDRSTLLQTLKKKFNAGIWGRYGINNYVENANHIYNTHRVTINLTHSREGTFTNRLFEAPGSGILLLTDHGTHLDQLYEVGREIIGYRSLEELIQLIEDYLINETEREKIAMAGHRRARRDHTWENRIEKILEVVI